MRQRTNRGFTLVELMIVIAIIGLLAAVLTVAVTHQMTKSRAELERVAAKDLISGLNQAMIDSRGTTVLRTGANRNLAGRDFWQACFKEKLLDEKLLAKLVSLNSNDVQLRDFPSEGGVLAAENCSYTAPRMGELRNVLNLSGKKRVVAFAHNSRNWGNYSKLDYGPLVMWSDGDIAEYLDPKAAMAEFKISQPDWERPAEGVIGRTQPFHRTYE